MHRIHSDSSRAAVLIVALLLVSMAVPAVGAADERWVLVDTGALTLSVMKGQQPQMTLHDIAIGRFGTSREKRRGDNLTPLGRFRVTRIDRNADFHRFIGLDYPDSERAHEAHRLGEIGQRELEQILAAHRRGDAPPQGTALGGHIGIHGLGRGDPALHESMNWTRGCVALTNDQVDALLPWVRRGMTVEIR